MKTLVLGKGSPYDYNDIFFTSDLHLQHQRIIEYCSRPFTDLDEMNKTLCHNWNTKVRENDIVFVLGDFCFGGQKNWLEFIYRLNGFIYLIKGNHDHSIPKNTSNLDKKFTWIDGFLNIRILDEEFDGGDQRITLCHYPMLSWYLSQKGAWHFFGHIHSGPKSTSEDKDLPIKSSQYDVGVDNNNYEPLSWDEIKIIMTQRLRQ